MPASKAKNVFNKTYLGFVRDLTRSIRQSRYLAASLVNRELLSLYLKIGRMIHEKIESENWGTGVVREISADIQRRLPGIKGFSARNLYSMRTFFEVYSALQFVQTVSAQIDTKAVKSTKTPKLLSAIINLNSAGEADFEKAFFGIGYSHHMRILSGCKNNDERYFYITNAAKNQWSFRVLDHHIDAALFRRKGRIQNNFQKTLPANLQKTALDSFRDEYLLNFIQITEEDSESAIEGSIITNIRDFLLSLGNEFAFLGNQYRLIVDEEEFFIDLLFYHRKLSCLVAFELKTGKFKPEYMGKMNFYLSALDELVKLEHENPSIGIILCKEKSKTIVEYAFRDTTKPMGVATFTYTKNLPRKYRDLLPAPGELQKFLR